MRVAAQLPHHSATNILLIADRMAERDARRHG